MLYDKYENEKIQTTPRSNKSCSLEYSVQSCDSGYLSFTPKSNESTYNSKLFYFRKFHRIKTSPYQFKFNKQFCISEAHGSETSNEHLFKCFAKNSDIDNSFIQQYTGYMSVKQSTKNSSKMQLRSHKKMQKKPSELITFTPKFQDNNVEKELAIPQSTPIFRNSPILPEAIYNVTISPIDCKDKSTINCINTNKFGKLTISDCLSTFRKSKPKRLDFSKRAMLSSFQKQRVTLDYTGKETVDIFKLLAEKSNHPRIITKILSYLNSKDLCSASMVSKSWQRICSNDLKAEERRLKYISFKQYSKENLLLFKKSKVESDCPTPKTLIPRRGFLTSVSTNLLQVPKVGFKSNSPPVSPSKIIFHSFVKAGRCLPLCDQLIPCPQCKFACRIKHEKNTGTCSRQGCPMSEFCILCSSKIHIGKPCKMLLLATPTKRSKKQMPVVGTKQCKRNLRRISRLV